MRGILVGLDLETTGLDAADAHIIEIGAVRFKDREILDTFTTLVNPGVSIPPKVVDLTGIKNEDVIGAPRIAEVLPKLIAFAGDAPIVGHNIEFDLRFVHKQGALTQNPAVDTYELASVLLPTAARYNLNALMQMLNIEPEGTYHRALTDAIAGARLYMTLWQKLLTDVPFSLLREIVGLASNLKWDGRLPFEAALKVREGEREAKEDSVSRAFARHLDPQIAKPKVASKSGSFDLESVRANVAPRFDAAAEATAEAFERHEALLLEAEDGRIPAYLIPAALWASKSGETVIVAAESEGTRRDMLETQLPALRNALPSLNFNAALLRKRTDYLCPAQLEALRRQVPTNVEELRLIAKTMIWLASGGDAYANFQPEAARLSIRGPGEQTAWLRLSAESCPLTRCEARAKEGAGLCPMHLAADSAKRAALVITPHKLLLTESTAVLGSSPEITAEPNLGPSLLPDSPHLIVDEAHTLEDSLTESLHVRIDTVTVKRLAADIGSADRGLLGVLLTGAKEALPPPTYEQIVGGVGVVSDAATQMIHHVQNLFRAVLSYLETVGDTRPSEFAITIRITDDLRHKAAYSQVRAAWSILGQFTETMATALTQLARRLRTFQEKGYAIPDLTGLIFGTERIGRQMAGLHARLNNWVMGASSRDTVYWAEIGSGGAGGGERGIERAVNISLHAAPLAVGGLLERHVWKPKQTVILTDATLRAAGSFEYLQGRLGAENFKMAVNDPQTDPDQPRALLVYVPVDVPEPTEKDRYQKFVERTIIELATATEGRLIALFTSFSQLRATAQYIAARLNLGDFAVFDQSDGTSFAALEAGFRTTPKAVLLGVRGFWEDTHFSEEELAALVIVRLPFPVPSEPVFAARSETFDDPLHQYTVPYTILRFRQAVERVIGGRTRRGVVAILDRRIITKEYGGAFVDSLPRSDVRRGPVADLATAAREWLNGNA